MECFFPSEISRLILGYLKEINCTKTWETFMTECSYLQEYNQLYKNGQVYPTNVAGKSLLEILNEYCELKSEARHGSTSQNQSIETRTNISDSHTFKTPNKTSTQHRASSTRYSDTTCHSSQVPSSSRGAQNRSSTGSLHPTHNKSVPNFGNLKSPSTRTFCQSEPRRKLHFAGTKGDRAKESHLYPHQSPSTICSDDESVVVLDSYLHGEQDAENSSVHSSSVMLVTSDNFSHSNVNSPHSSVYEIPEAPSEDNQASNVNRGVVHQSAEVTACPDSIVFTTSSVSLTPHRNLNPPSYHRAPATNSPRIILSYDRSQVSSLTTPLKKRWREDFISPRRKSIPRRRLLNDSPLPKATIDYPLNALHDDLELILEEFFTQQPLAQKIADNINKIKEDVIKIPEVQNTGPVPLQDVQAPGRSPNNTVQETEGAIEPQLSISKESNSYRDDINSTREPASYPNEISGHITEPDASIPERSLPPSAPVSSLSAKEKTPTNQCPEGLVRPDTDSENQAMPTADEVQSTAIEGSTHELEDPPLDLVYCDGGNSKVSSGSHTLETPADDNAGSTAGQPEPNKSKTITEVTIGTPFNIETQMVDSPSVPSSQVNPQPNKKPAVSNTDQSFNTGVSVSSTPLNIGVSNTGVAANMITLPNGNISIIPAVQNTLYQTPAFVQLPYTNRSTSYVLPSSNGTGGIQYMSFNVVPSNSGVPPVAFGAVQTTSATLEGTSILSQSPLRIPADYSPMKSLWPGSILQNNSNVGSFVTISSNISKKKKTNAFDVSDSPISSNIVTAEPNIVATSKADKVKKKKKTNAISVSDGPISQNIVAVHPQEVATSNSHKVKETSSSHITQENKDSSQPKRKRKKQPKKVSRLKPLFPSPPKKDSPKLGNFPDEADDQIPVLSIPEPSPRNESMSAYEILQGIAGIASSTRKTEQSPILKSLISSAKQWTGDGGIISNTCVRTLNFDSPAKKAPSPKSSSLNKETISSPECVKRKSSRLMQKSGPNTPQKAAADDASSKQQETKKSRSRSGSSNKSAPSVTNKDQQCDQSSTNITTIEDVINHANENYTGAVLQIEVLSENCSDTPGNKNENHSPHKPEGESGTISRTKHVSRSPYKEKIKQPEKPIAKSSYISREEYFPSSDSESSSENVPLASLLAAKKAFNSKQNDNVSKPLEQEHLQSNKVSSFEIPDFELTNDKPSELDNEIVPSKKDLQNASGKTKECTPKLPNKSKLKKVSQPPKRTIIPKLPPKSEFRSSGKLKAMFKTMLNTSSREEMVESNGDSSESEINELSSSLERSEESVVEQPSHLKKSQTNNSPETLSVKSTSPVKSVEKTVNTSKIPDRKLSNTARGSAVLNVIKDSKNLRAAATKKRKNSLKSNVSCASKNDVRTGDSFNFVPSVSALRKSSKDSVQPLNLNTFTNEKVMEKLLKGSTSVSHDQQSNFLNSQLLSQNTVSSPHEDQSSSSFVCFPKSRNSRKVLPPPKKRIRPVPSTNQYSPFLTIQSPEQTTSLNLSSQSQNPTLPSLSGESNLHNEPAPKTTSPSLPKEKALSGKPRAMAEFYQQLRPNMKDGIPFSPETMSSSSCTLDTFIARYQPKNVEVYDDEPLNLVSPAKGINSTNDGVKRKLIPEIDESLGKDLVLSPDKPNIDKTMSREDTCTQEIVEPCESLNLVKSSECVISPEKREISLPGEDLIGKNKKHSEIKPANPSKPGEKIPDDDSFEEGEIIDSPCKETDKNPKPIASFTGEGFHVQSPERCPNPVDFSLGKNQTSSVQRTVFGKYSPHQDLGKKFDLNPKFSQDRNNSKSPSYSQAFKRNSQSKSIKQNYSMHSKRSKSRMLKSTVKFYTPEKRYSSKRKNHNPSPKKHDIKCTPVEKSKEKKTSDLKGVDLISFEAKKNLYKSSEKGVIKSLEKRETSTSGQDLSAKKKKHSEIEPSTNILRTGGKIPDSDSFVEHVIVDSPSKKTDKNPDLGASVTEADCHILSSESCPNPVDFNQRQGQMSPVQSTDFIERDPHQVVEKMSELNPKYSRDRNSSKFSGSSQTIVESSKSKDVETNESMHSKRDKTRKHSSKVRLNTPQEKHPSKSKSYNPCSLKEHENKSTTIEIDKEKKALDLKKVDHISSKKKKSFHKSSEESVITSLEKTETRISVQDISAKKRKHSEIEPSSNFLKTGEKTSDVNSFEEGMIIDSPCKKPNKNPKPNISADSRVQSTESCPNPVSFSQRQNQNSPVRSTALVECVPPQALRKKYELNPKFPAGVKFPRNWNNSKLSHYSKAIEKNSQSESVKQIDTVYSRRAKARKLNSNVKLNTPEEKYPSKGKTPNPSTKEVENKGNVVEKMASDPKKVAPTSSEAKESESSVRLSSGLEKELKKQKAAKPKKTKELSHDVDAETIPVVLETNVNQLTNVTENMSIPVDTSRQNMDSGKTQSGPAEKSSGPIKVKPKGKAKKKPVIGAIRSQSETEQINSTTEANLNVSVLSEKSPESSLVLDSSRTSTDQNELEEAIASISSKSGAQSLTPRKNPDGSNWNEASASDVYKEQESPIPEQESLHMACSQSKSEKMEKVKDGNVNVTEIISRIEKLGGMKNILDMIRRTSDLKE